MRYANTPMFSAWVLALVVGWPAPSRADVVFSGPVLPGDPAEVNGDVTVEVGYNNFGGQPGEDPRASIVVDGGSSLTAERYFVGNSPRTYASMVITGPATKVTADEAGDIFYPSFGVGYRGDGYLLVDDGAWLDVSGRNGSGVMVVGAVESQALVPARADVQGPSTLVTVGRELHVGSGLSPRLNVADGAVVAVGADSRVGVVSVDNGGVIDVAGDRTRLLYGSRLRVGQENPNPDFDSGGVLSIRDGATVYPPQGFKSQTSSVFPRGVVELDGGSLAAQLSVRGRIGGDGSIVGGLTIEQGGELSVGPGQHLTISGQANNLGVTHVAGGQLEFSSRFQQLTSGRQAESRLVADDAVVRFQDRMINASRIVANSGDSQFYGTITDQNGSLLVRSGASVQFHGDAEFADLTIQAGGSAVFHESPAFFGNLSFGIASPADPQEDLAAPLLVAGQADYHGLRLSVGAVEPLTFGAGTLLPLIEADRFNGSIAEYDLPELNGSLEFVPQVTDKRLSLLVVDAALDLPGDFNADGAVDAADYTVWRDGLPGGSTELDFIVWRANYGRSLAAIARGVPEPATLATVAFALTLASGLRRSA